MGLVWVLGFAAAVAFAQDSAALYPGNWHLTLAPTLNDVFAQRLQQSRDPRPIARELLLNPHLPIGGLLAGRLLGSIESCSHDGQDEYASALKTILRQADLNDTQAQTRLETLIQNGSDASLDVLSEVLSARPDFQPGATFLSLLRARIERTTPRDYELSYLVRIAERAGLWESEPLLTPRLIEASHSPLPDVQAAARRAIQKASLRSR